MQKIIPAQSLYFLHSKNTKPSLLTKIGYAEQNLRLHSTIPSLSSFRSSMKDNNNLNSILLFLLCKGSLLSLLFNQKTIYISDESQSDFKLNNFSARFVTLNRSSRFEPCNFLDDTKSCCMFSYFFLLNTEQNACFPIHNASVQRR